MDGLGGKYSSSWLYYYLIDPQALMPQSKMPSYPNLDISPLDEENLSKIRKNRRIKINDKNLWKNLINQAEILSEELTRQGGITTNNTEILALIAYLQRIPSTKKKVELDSLALAKVLHKQKVWDNVALDSSSIILEISNNEENIGKGKLLFIHNCSPCHGQQGEGVIGPNLTDDFWLHGGNKLDIARTIIYGVPEKGMMSWKKLLTPIEVGELISFITSLKGTNPKNAKAPQGKKQ